MPRDRRLRDRWAPIFAVLALLLLPGCSSTADLGELRQDLVTDNIHAWVGRDAARAAGGPVSHFHLTEDERTLRDLAFPLIEPPYDRQRWNAVIYEYGVDRLFDRGLWIENPTNYYALLEMRYRRSSAARYNRLIDDMRNDIVRIEPFFMVARHIVDLDRRREATLQHVADLSFAEHANAQARIDENSLTIAWVSTSLTQRCASYRYALEHIAVAEPEPLAAEADQVLRQLQQTIATHQVVVVAPHFAGGPIAPPPAL